MIGRACARCFRLGLLGALLVWGECSATAEGVCDNMLSFTPIPDGTSIAFVVEREGVAEKLEWFNNDDTVVFPRVRVVEALSCAGYAPGAVRAEIANVSGGAEAWTTVDLDGGIESGTGLFYVIFDLPNESTFTGRGTGGGPAFGYYGTAGRGAYVLGGDGTRVHLLGMGAVALLASNSTEKAMPGKGQATNSGRSELAGPRLVAWPNPVTDAAEISLTLTRSGPFKVDIYDLRGRLVRSLASGPGAVGEYTRVWDRADDSGRQVAAGVYYARLAAEGTIRTQRMAVVR